MRILFFSPFSGILEFSALEARLAKSLAREGHELIMATCGGLFHQYCVVMSAHGLQPNSTKEERETICRDCSMYAEVLHKCTGMRTVKLNDIYSEHKQVEVKKFISMLDNNSALALQEGGIPVGRRALYPFLALKKKSSLNLTEQEWLEYRNQLCNTLFSVGSANILFDKYHPDIVITYSSTYSITSACLEVARGRGIKDYFIEASSGMGSRDYRAIFARGSISQWYAGLSTLWKEASVQPAKPEHMKFVTKHMLYLFESKSPLVYSTSTSSGDFDARKHFGASPNQKLLLATMSSYDEWFAAEQAGLFPIHKSTFASQSEWIELLFQILRRRPDLFLIIRVHPREFPNQRDSLYSEHVGKLKLIFESAPLNCRINWPEEKISLYDIAKNINVVLNAWSSSGRDLSLLGLPVVEWAPDLLFYPPDKKYIARKASEYEDCINKAVKDGWNAKRILKMYRWLSLEFGSATFQSSVEALPKNKLSKFIQKVRRGIKQRISGTLLFNEFLNSPISFEVSNDISSAIKLNVENLAQLKNKKNIISELEEERALINEVNSLIIGLFGDKHKADSLLKNALLEFVDSTISSIKNDKKYE